MKAKLYTAPTLEPVSLRELKEHCRIDGPADDVFLAELGKGARQRVEELTGRALVTQTWELALDVMPCENYVELPFAAPLQSVTSVTSYSDSDVATVMSASSYHVDTYNHPGRVVLASGQVWPIQGETRTTNGLIIRYICGYGANGTLVPEALNHAIKEWVRGDYDNDPEAIERAHKLMRPYCLVWA